MEKEHNEIILRTYGSVWKIDRKIYSIDGLRLPFPIVLDECIYLVVSFGFTLLFSKIIPFFNNLNWAIKWLLIPFAITKALTTIKLDGKLAHKFIIDYIKFVFSPKKYSKFKPIITINEKIKFDYRVMFKREKVVNKTELAIAKDSRR